MEMDLTVVPIRNHQCNWWLAHTRIDFERNYELFAQISKEHGRNEASQVLRPLPLPLGVKFDWYEDDGIKTRVDDPYGEKLTYVLGTDFNKVYTTVDTGRWNKSVLTFLSLLNDIPVVLWWH